MELRELDSRRGCDAPGLLSDEAVELLAAYRSGDAARVREALIKAYWGLVEKVVSRFACSGVQREDLLQEGVIGLVKAIDNFDPGRQAPLRAYAHQLVVGHIQHYLRDRAELVRPGRHGDRVERCHVVSLDGIVASGPDLAQGETRLIGDALATDGGLGAGFAMGRALDCLSPLHRQALEMRFVDRLGMTQVAAELGLDVKTTAATIEEGYARLARALDLELDATSQDSGVRFDPLSGLLSRPAFLRRLAEELERAERQADVLSLGLVELAAVPTIDLRSERQVLRAVGELLHSGIRRTDVAGRLKERTFAIALPRTDLTGCNAMLARVLGALRGKALLLASRAGACCLSRGCRRPSCSPGYGRMPPAQHSYRPVPRGLKVPFSQSCIGHGGNPTYVPSD